MCLPVVVLHEHCQPLSGQHLLGRLWPWHLTWLLFAFGWACIAFSCLDDFSLRCSGHLPQPCPSKVHLAQECLNLCSELREPLLRSQAHMLQAVLEEGQKAGVRGTHSDAQEVHARDASNLEVGQGLQRFDAEGANLHSLLLSRFAIDIIACLKDDCKQLFELGTVPGLFSGAFQYLAALHEVIAGKLVCQGEFHHLDPCRTEAAQRHHPPLDIA
mmetsp:Transcript_6886/g.16344  ORF Transcript_6886/g.16344 Transcript_6886/m.16344 type:complete len:215 (-) Transcript_6886:1170-1814(-)